MQREKHGFALENKPQVNRKLWLRAGLWHPYSKKNLTPLAAPLNPAVLLVQKAHFCSFKSQSDTTGTSFVRQRWNVFPSLLICTFIIHQKFHFFLALCLFLAMRFWSRTHTTSCIPDVLFLPFPNCICLQVPFRYVHLSTNMVKRLIRCRGGGKGSQKVKSLPKDFTAAMIPIFFLDVNIWQQTHMLKLLYMQFIFAMFALKASLFWRNVLLGDRRSRSHCSASESLGMTLFFQRWENILIPAPHSLSCKLPVSESLLHLVSFKIQNPLNNFFPPKLTLQYFGSILACTGLSSLEPGIRVQMRSLI